MDRRALPRRVMDVLLALRKEMASAPDSSEMANLIAAVDEDTLKSNTESLKVEAAARKDMEKTVNKMTHATKDEVIAALKKTKAKALARSPLPTLSEIALDEAIADMMFTRTLRAFITTISNSSDLNKISVALLAIVMEKTNKNPTLYPGAVALTKTCTAKLLSDHNANFSPVLHEAFEKVAKSAQDFAAVHEAKQKKTAEPSENAADSSTDSTDSTSAPASGPTASHVAEILLASQTRPRTLCSTRLLVDGGEEGMCPESWELFETFFDTRFRESRAVVHRRVILQYHLHLDEGIWQLFQSLSIHKLRCPFLIESWTAERSFYRSNLRNAILQSGGVEKTVREFQPRGMCAAMMVVTIAQRTTHQVRLGAEFAYLAVRILANLSNGFPDIKDREWLTAFDRIGRVFAEYFAALLKNLIPFAPADMAILAVDVAAFTFTFVLGDVDPLDGEFNLGIIEKLVFETLTVPDNRPARAGSLDLLRDSFSQIRRLCRSHVRRCHPEHGCKAVMDHISDDDWLIPDSRVGGLSDLVNVTLVMSQIMELAATGLPQDVESARNKPFQSQVKMDLSLIGDWQNAELAWHVLKHVDAHVQCLTGDNKCECGEIDQNFGCYVWDLKPAFDAAITKLVHHVRKGTMPEPRALKNICSPAWLIDEALEVHQVCDAELAQELSPLTEPVSTPFVSRQIHQIFRTAVIQMEDREVRQEFLRASQQLLDELAGRGGNTSLTGPSPSHVSTDSPTSASSSLSSSTDLSSRTIKMSAPNRNQPGRQTGSSKLLPPMTARELEIKGELTDTIDGALKGATCIKTHGSGIVHLCTHKCTEKHLWDAAIRSLELVYIIARCRKYKGLYAWLTEHYGRHDPNYLHLQSSEESDGDTARQSDTAASTGTGDADNAAKKKNKKRNRRNRKKKKQAASQAESDTETIAGEATAMKTVSCKGKGPADPKQAPEEHPTVLGTSQLTTAIGNNNGNVEGYDIGFGTGRGPGSTGWGSGSSARYSPYLGSDSGPSYSSASGAGYSSGSGPGYGSRLRPGLGAGSGAIYGTESGPGYGPGSGSGSGPGSQPMAAPTKDKASADQATGMRLQSIRAPAPTEPKPDDKPDLQALGREYLKKMIITRHQKIGSSKREKK